MAKKLSVAQKLLISNILYLIPLIVLLGTMINEKNKQISYTINQTSGNAYERPLIGLLEQISRHKLIMQRTLSGDETSRSTQRGIESDIDKLMDTLSATDTVTGASLKISNDKYMKISQQWKDLKSKGVTLNIEESNDLHTSLLANIRGMITQVGELSHLSLDSNLELSHLIDMTLIALPQAEDHMQEIMTHIETWTKKGKVSSAEKKQLFMLSGLLKHSDLSRIETDSESAFNSHSASNSLSSVHSELNSNLGEFISLLQKVSTHETKHETNTEDRTENKSEGKFDSSSENKTESKPETKKEEKVSFDNLTSSAERASSSLYKYSSFAMSELDTLLNKNLDTLRSERGLVILAGLLSLVLSAISFVLSQSVKNGFAGITEGLFQAGNQVAVTGGHLLDASRQVSAGTSSSASSLEETASAVEELSSMVKQNADNAKQAATLAQNSSASAAQGEVEIQNLIGSMTEISQGSKKIEEIINVIDDIAFQTNLLALNAAVEAARAGEQGKGFAVVAEAVRNLAQRSAAAAKDIADLIKDSVSKIERGTKVADSSGSVLKNIVGSIKKVSDLNNEIASASAEQANGITQISQAMSELDTTTQQNAGASTAVASSAQEMLDEASKLQGLVQSLNLIVTGRATGRKTDSIKHDDSHENTDGPQEQKRTNSASSKTKNASQKPFLVVNNDSAAPRTKAQQVIPFEENATGKVGTTDGF